MNDPMFNVAAEGIDASALVTEIRRRVAEKKAGGCYADPRVAQAERHNLIHLRDSRDFLSFYVECLRDAVSVDINDFEIVERRSRFSRLLIATKKALWKLLKFYTYRLWSQQNQVNALLLAAYEASVSHYDERLRTLEKRICDLEERLCAQHPPQGKASDTLPAAKDRTSPVNGCEAPRNP